MRFVIALVLFLAAAALLIYAGGLNVQSVADWKDVFQKWSMPGGSETERRFALLAGSIVAILALSRLLHKHHARAVR
jgi:hypothetical protein